MTNSPVNTEEVLKSLSFDEAFGQVKEQMLNKLSHSPKIVRGFTEHLTLTQGKYIRAMSLLTCAMDERNLIHPDAVALSVAVELLHLATLVHDDVIDDAPIRRGVITLQKKFGKRMAVICGDYLLCLALQAASQCKNRNDYVGVDIPNYMSRLCLGELNQSLNNGNLNLSVYRYLKIISGKTAALFEASFFGGAILCECRKEKIDVYKKLGHYIGMMFQITDDCNDYEINRAEATKPVQSDYEQGVITLPLIYTLNNQQNFRQKLSTGNINGTELSETVLQSGGLHFSHRVNKRYYQKSLDLLDKLTLTEEKRSRLIELLNKSCNWK